MNSNLLEQPSTHCANCAAETAEEDAFCQECGSHLQTPAWTRFSDKLTASYRTVQGRLTESKKKLPKLPTAAPAILVLIVCAVTIPWCVHAIDTSYDVMSEDYIAQSALKALKANNPVIAGELLLRIYMERSGKLTKENVSLLGKCMLRRADDSIKAKDFTAAMQSLRQVPKECPEYTVALATMKKLESAGTVTTQATATMPMPVIPAAPAPAAVAPGATATAAQATATAAPGSPATAGATPAATTTGAAPMSAAPGATPATGGMNPAAGTPDAIAATTAAAQAAQAAAAAQAQAAKQTAATAPAKVAEAPTASTKVLQKFIANTVGTVQKAASAVTAKPADSQAAAPAVTLSTILPSDTAQPSANQTPASASSPKPAPSSTAVSSPAPQAMATETAAAQTTKGSALTLQPGVPIWQTFSHAGNLNNSKKETKKKAAIAPPAAGASGTAITSGNAEQAPPVKQHKAGDSSGFFIDGKEISGDPGNSVRDKTGQRSRTTEGPKSYNPDDISRYNELLAAYFKQHDAVSSKSASSDSNDKTSNTPDPPSFQEWVNKGKPGFR